MVKEKGGGGGIQTTDRYSHIAFLFRPDGIGQYFDKKEIWKPKKENGSHNWTPREI